jgi:hypothetical protein
METETVTETGAEVIGAMDRRGGVRCGGGCGVTCGLRLWWWWQLATRVASLGGGCGCNATGWRLRLQPVAEVEFGASVARRGDLDGAAVVNHR